VTASVEELQLLCRTLLDRLGAIHKDREGQEKELSYARALIAAQENEIAVKDREIKKLLRER